MVCLLVSVPESLLLVVKRYLGRWVEAVSVGVHFWDVVCVLRLLVLLGTFWVLDIDLLVGLGVSLRTVIGELLLMVLIGHAMRIIEVVGYLLRIVRHWH